MSVYVDIPNLLTYRVFSTNLIKKKIAVLVGEIHVPKICEGKSYGELLFEKFGTIDDDKKRCIYVEMEEKLPDKDSLKEEATPISSTVYHFYDHQNQYKNNIKLQSIEQRNFENIFSIFSTFYFFVSSSDNLIFRIEKLRFLSQLNSWKELKIIFDCFFDEKG